MVNVIIAGTMVPAVVNAIVDSSGATTILAIQVWRCIQHLHFRCKFSHVNWVKHVYGCVTTRDSRGHLTQIVPLYLGWAAAGCFEPRYRGIQGVVTSDRSEVSNLSGRGEHLPQNDSMYRENNPLLPQIDVRYPKSRGGSPIPRSCRGKTWPCWSVVLRYLGIG